jgi:hypothetical protein
MGAPPSPVLTASAAVALLVEISEGRSEALGALDNSPMLVVDLGVREEPSIPLVPWLPCVTVAVLRCMPRQRAPAGADIAIASCKDSPSDVANGEVPAGWVAVDDVDLWIEALSTHIADSVQAAIALSQVLRFGITCHGDVVRALFDESLVYSNLQSGPRFAEWLASRGGRGRQMPPSDSEAGEEGLLVDRHGDTLTLTLNRPHVRNALDMRMRDALAAALAVAVVDPSIRDVHLRGAGPAFCAGGDLHEFGTAPDPVTAHLVRSTRNPARILARIGAYATAHLHGACIGAGIELAAFCHRVVAAPDTLIQLPEVGFGLIPGAGGTASLPRRIGRQRTCWLGLTSAQLDASTALAWGLVDAVD